MASPSPKIFLCHSYIWVVLRVLSWSRASNFLKISVAFTHSYETIIMIRCAMDDLLLRHHNTDKGSGCVKLAGVNIHFRYPYLQDPKIFDPPK